MSTVEATFPLNFPFANVTGVLGIDGRCPCLHRSYIREMMVSFIPLVNGGTTTVPGFRHRC